MQTKNINKRSVIKEYPKAGVIYVMEEAAKKGFAYGHPEWSNLGQGMPNVNKISGSLERINQIQIDNFDHGYAPVAGMNKLRIQVADLYNQLFRKNSKSQYSNENVCIAGGGRLVLSRIFASLNKRVRIAYFLPDYASYEGILSIFDNTTPIAIKLSAKEGFKINLEKFQKFIQKNSIEALLLSNPTNPTGNLLKEEELKTFINICRDNHVLVILDEFYFNYIYSVKNKIVSAAEFINNVNSDQILLISGISKGWRYPGWRIAWVLGPKKIIESISSVGSFLDGGANHPLQKAVCDIVNINNFRQESIAIQQDFKLKRDYMIKRLTKMGIIVNGEVEGAFYIWADLSKLPKSINQGMDFFKRGLDYQVISVPGIFFDLNPYKKRKKQLFTKNIRFSFASEMVDIIKGLNAYEKMINDFR
ncbi:MAG: pyridoxal phosphate-dependent aminotransferase [Patescibacteria group bacterium]|nr:pyridoxal phosphate-dependent aminotransferase [Patescibacteria group bacterium]